MNIFIKSKKYITKSLLFALVFVVTSSSPAGAIDTGFYSSNDILFSNPQDICVLGGTQATTLVGSDNTDKSMRYLVSKGLSTEQAASIVAGLYLASGLSPTLNTGGTSSKTPVEGSGFGIAQWSTKDAQDRLVQLATTNNLSVDSLELQLNFLWSDIGPSSISNLITDIKNAASPDEASLVFYKAYIDPNIVNNDAQLTNLHEQTGSLIESFTDRLATSPPSCNQGVSGYTSDKFVVYNQNDPQWSQIPYGSSTIGAAGCGPSAMAAIITALTKKQVTPKDTAAYGMANGTYNYGPDGGSKWNLDTVIGNNWGLKSKALSKDVNQINDGLRSGGLVIISGTGPTPFTVHGHFIVIRGVTDTNQWLIADSNGKTGQQNSTIPWDPQSILTSASSFVRLLTVGG